MGAFDFAEGLKQCYVELHPFKGHSIGAVAREACAVAIVLNSPVEFTFNGVLLRVLPDDLPGTIIKRYREHTQKKTPPDRTIEEFIRVDFGEGW